MSDEDTVAEGTIELERTIKYVDDLHFLVSEQLPPELVERGITTQGGMKELEPHIHLSVSIEVEKLDEHGDQR